MNEISVVQSEPPAPDKADATSLIRGLGWLGVTLGVTELVIPRLLASAIGVDPDGAAPAILRAMGVREIASSSAVLLRPDHPSPRWARVIGDAIDLGLLGLALTTPGTGKRRLGMALGMVAGVTALDVLAARRQGRARHPLPVIAAVTINKPPMEVYEFCRRLEQLPLFMNHLVSVEQHANRRSTWTARLPVVGTVRWETELVEDRPGQVLSWRSVEGSQVQTRGRVTFTRAPGRDMTEVRIEMQLGVLGREPSIGLARLVARPQVKGDLRRLKQVLETGEVLRSDASVYRLPHPAQPSPARHEISPPRVFLESPPTAAKGVSP
ncbi:MAG TPA: SRPBCC family protein [Kofleriaceae bacterium]